VHPTLLNKPQINKVLPKFAFMPDICITLAWFILAVIFCRCPRLCWRHEWKTSSRCCCSDKRLWETSAIDKKCCLLQSIASSWWLYTWGQICIYIYTHLVILTWYYANNGRYREIAQDKCGEHIFCVHVENLHCNEIQGIFIISSTGAAICTAVVVARCNSGWQH
jgi:hypothetical protein